MAFDLLLLGENRPALDSVLRALRGEPRLAVASLRLADDTLGGQKTKAHNQKRVLQERSARFRVAGELQAASWTDRALAVPLLIEHLDLLAAAIPESREPTNDPMTAVWEHLFESLHDEQALVWVSGGTVESRHVAEWRTIAGHKPLLVVDARTVIADRERFVDFLEQRLGWPETIPTVTIEPPPRDVVLTPQARSEAPDGPTKVAPQPTRSNA